MENKLIKLSSFEAIAIILIITINKIILSQPQKIVSSMGSGALLNIIYISILVFIFTLMIIKMFKRFNNCDIIDISEYIGGKLLKTIIGFILILYLILIGATYLRNFSEILFLTCYNQTKILYLLIFFILISLISNIFGDQAIIKTNVLITIIIIFSLLISFYLITGNLIPQKIFPLLGHGPFNTFAIGLFNIISYSGIICIYFITPFLSDKSKFKSISLTSITIIGILTLLSSLCLLLSASDSLENILPLYPMIAYNKLGSFIQHPESIYIFTWILSLISYLNIVIMLSIYLLKKITGFNKKKSYIVPICVFILIISFIPQNIIETHYLEEIIDKYISFPLTFIIFPIILLIGNLKIKKKG